ncbi:unnamed protein product [Calypogeia fissa]
MGRGALEKGFGAKYNYTFSHPSHPNHSNGGHRKAVDHQIGRSRWCLTRIWAFVVTFASLFLLASVTPIGNSIQAKVFYPRKLVFSYPRDSGSSTQLLWERRTEQMFALSFNALRQKGGGTGSNSNSATSKPHPRSLTSHGGGGPLTKPSSTDGVQKTGSGGISATRALSTPPFIEDFVILPENLDLFIVRHGSKLHQERISACKYGEGLSLKSVPRMIDMLPDHRLGVTCTRPPSLRAQKTLIQYQNVSLEMEDGVGAAALVPLSDGILMPARWNGALVYAAQSTDVDVVLYVKNLFNTSGRKASEYTELDSFRCRFGEAVETPVTAGANEVFRCEFPSVNHPTTVATRVKVHLLYKGKTIPSVAYYEPMRGNGAFSLRDNGDSDLGLNKVIYGAGVIPPRKKYLICSCTMIWNVAKFLKEWVLYNSDLGVEKFFLYDNNSEDEIRTVVSELSEYNVTRINWPWVKTQEAGFSNCAIEAQRECTWVLFTDVDEYLFPKRWLKREEDIETGETTATTAPSAAAEEDASSSVETSPLASLIEDTFTRVSTFSAARKGSKAISKKLVNPVPSLQVGQISFLCRSFGPSGRTTSPSHGVTQGYTCRDPGEQRHKSMVYFPALKSSLQNVIHHFQLKPSFQTVYLDTSHAVVNHYKYQVWSEFEKKFARRASTYVVDWKEPKNLNSRDRPEGVGPDATKPPDWETSHCTLNDTSLRDYTRRRYGILGTGDSVKMAWERL